MSPRYAPALGGVEKIVQGLARGLLSRGVQAEVLTTDHLGHLPAREVLEGVEVRRFPALARQRLHGLSPQLAWWLLRHAHKYDVVHAYSYHTPLMLMAACAATARGLPYVITPVYHGGSHTASHGILHSLYAPAGGWMLRQAGAVVCLSEAERAELHRHFGPRPRSRVVPPGIDRPADVPGSGTDMTSTDAVVLTVSRLEPYKQLDRLVLAAVHLSQEFQIVIAGEGPARAALESLIALHDLRNRVRLLGPVPKPDLDTLYQRANVFAALSRHESFGLTILEAAASGAVVVASNIAAHREVARYVPTGRVWFVDENASPDEVAIALRAAASEGRALDIEDWLLPTWDDSVNRMLECYAAVAHGAN